jgi:hypothetical protein
MNSEWQDAANCATVDPELFYDDESYSDALGVCGACPVVVQCRAYVDSVERDPRDIHGVAAGETGGQRIKRRWPRYRGGRHVIPQRQLDAVA